MASRPPLVDCPHCETHIALLPSSVYKSVEGVDPGMMENMEGNVEAMFAIYDEDDGRYTCPNCQQVGTFGP
jgi:hypothetical protein